MKRKRVDRSGYPVWYWVVIANLQVVSAIYLLLILVVLVKKIF